MGWMLVRSGIGASVARVVPLHDELATGTLRGILKQARIITEEFIKQL